jgi:hypothetical protein
MGLAFHFGNALGGFGLLRDMNRGRQNFAAANVTNPSRSDKFLADHRLNRTGSRHKGLKSVYDAELRSDWQIACISGNAVRWYEVYKSLVHLDRNGAIRGEVR